MIRKGNWLINPELEVGLQKELLKSQPREATYAGPLRHGIDLQKILEVIRAKWTVTLWVAARTKGSDGQWKTNTDWYLPEIPGKRHPLNHWHWTGSRWKDWLHFKLVPNPNYGNRTTPWKRDGKGYIPQWWVKVGTMATWSKDVLQRTRLVPDLKKQDAELALLVPNRQAELELRKIEGPQHPSFRRYFMIQNGQLYRTWKRTKHGRIPVTETIDADSWKEWTGKEIVERLPYELGVFVEVEGCPIKLINPTWLEWFAWDRELESHRQEMWRKGTDGEWHLCHKARTASGKTVYRPGIYTFAMPEQYLGPDGQPIPNVMLENIRGYLTTDRAHLDRERAKFDKWEESGSDPFSPIGYYEGNTFVAEGTSYKIRKIERDAPWCEEVREDDDPWARTKTERQWASPRGGGLMPAKFHPTVRIEDMGSWDFEPEESAIVAEEQGRPWSEKRKIQRVYRSVLNWERVIEAARVAREEGTPLEEEVEWNYRIEDQKWSEWIESLRVRWKTWVKGQGWVSHLCRGLFQMAAEARETARIEIYEHDEVLDEFEMLLAMCQDDERMASEVEPEKVVPGKSDDWLWDEASAERCKIIKAVSYNREDYEQAKVIMQPSDDPAESAIIIAYVSEGKLISEVADVVVPREMRLRRAFVWGNRHRRTMVDEKVVWMDSDEDEETCLLAASVAVEEEEQIEIVYEEPEEDDDEGDDDEFCPSNETN